ncbi:HlyD family secretion protein [Alteromonadaceae bacterium Bs31]|nr:HlyD family secretion protein [Alteromonadaceae bacterium Bs31]
MMLKCLRVLNGLACVFNRRISYLVLMSLVAVLSACGQKDGDTALGTIERDRVILKATVSEIINELPVREGTQVEKGRVLVQLDGRRQQAKLAKAEAEQMRAAAHWEALRNGARVEDIGAAKADVSGAEASLAVAEKNYQRSVELRRKNLNTQAALDRALANRDSAQAVLESAREHLLVLTNGTRKEELDQAEAQFKAAQAQVELEKIQLAELTVVATRDGLLDSLPWNRGERVTAGSAVAVLLVGAGPYARVYVPEPWRVRLRPGQTLQVKVDGLEEPYTGTLRWISSDPAFTPYYALNERDRSRLVYLAEVDLAGAENIPVGIPAEVILRAGE